MSAESETLSKVESILTLFRDPLPVWGLDKQKIIQEFENLMCNTKLTFLGWKSDKSEFQEKLDSTNLLDDIKYINLYALAENNIANINLNNDVLCKLNNKPFTSDVYIKDCTSPELIKLRKKLSELFEVTLDDIRMMFVHSNTVLFSHRDDEYYKKNKLILEGTNYVRLTDAVLTSVAFNWSLTGTESTFRIKHGAKEFTNEIDKTAAMLFDPCKYKHGTTKSTPRLTLSVRVANIEFNDALAILSKKLEIIQINN